MPFKRKKPFWDRKNEMTERNNEKQTNKKYQSATRNEEKKTFLINLYNF